MRAFFLFLLLSLSVLGAAQITQSTTGQAGSVTNNQKSSLLSGNNLLPQADDKIAGHGAAATSTSYSSGLITVADHACTEPPLAKSDIASGTAVQDVLDTITIKSSTLSLGTGIDIQVCTALQFVDELRFTHGVGGGTASNGGSVSLNFYATAYFHSSPDSISTYSSYYHSGMTGGGLNKPSATGLFVTRDTPQITIIHTHVGDSFKFSLSLTNSSTAQSSDMDLSLGDIRTS